MMRKVRVLLSVETANVFTKVSGYASANGCNLL